MIEFDGSVLLYRCIIIIIEFFDIKLLKLISLTNSIHFIILINYPICYYAPFLTNILLHNKHK